MSQITFKEYISFVKQEFCVFRFVYSRSGT